MTEGPGLPEGTVTVLFTDLVGSTQLNQALGDQAAGAVERERIFEPVGVKSATMSPDAALRARVIELAVDSAINAMARNAFGMTPDDMAGGGLVPVGTATHAGAGGIAHWIDFEHEIVGVYYEILTEMSEMLEPVSSAGHRFQDVITAAVVD